MFNSPSPQRHNEVIKMDQFLSPKKGQFIESPIRGSPSRSPRREKRDLSPDSKLSGIESPLSKLGQRRGVGKIDLRNVKGLSSIDQASISSPRKRSIEKTDVFIVGEVSKEEKGEVSNTTIQVMR